MKFIRISGCLLLLLTAVAAYFVIQHSWSVELKILAFVGIIPLVYVGVAALLTKTKKSFKKFVEDVASSFPWFPV